MPQTRRRAWASLTLVFLLSGAGSLALLEGHVLPLAGVAEVGGDHGLMIWNLWIVDESITQGRNPYATDRIYYPLGARLSKHTLVAGYWPVTFVTHTMSADPRYSLMAYRLSILLSFALALGLTYHLFRTLGFAWLVALPLAVQFAFCAFDRLHIPHLNHISAAVLLPSTALILIGLYRRPTAGRAALLGVALAAGVYFTELVVFVYLALPLALLLAAASSPLREALQTRGRALGRRGLLAFAVAFLLTLAPFAANWMADSGKAPKSRQAANWSANLAGFVTPNPDHTPVYGRTFAALSSRLRKGIAGQEVFLGFPILLLTVVAAFRRPSAWERVVAGLALVFLVLSLGPALKVGGLSTGVPLPYALLMKVPPFDVGRTPVRCVLLGVFCLSLLAAGSLAWLGDRVRARFGSAAAHALGAAFSLWALAEAWAPVPRVPEYAPPAGLAKLVPGPVVNVPLSVFDGYAVFLQTFHGQPLATGFVSRRSPQQVEHVRALDRLLEQDTAGFLRRVQALGIRNVILGPGTPPGIAEGLVRGPVNVVDLRNDGEAPVLPSTEDLEPDPGAGIR